MPIEVICTTCGATLPAPEQFFGKQIRCADCNGLVRVPLAPTRAPVPSTPYALPVDSIPFSATQGETIPNASPQSATKSTTKPQAQADPPKLPVWKIVFSLLLLITSAIGVSVWYTRQQNPRVPNPEPQPSTAGSPTTPSVASATPSTNDGTRDKGINYLEELSKAPATPTALASSIPGLKFHLAFEELKNNRVWESVQKKLVGTTSGVSLTDGVHGQAIKMVLSQRDSGPLSPTIRYALDLTDEVNSVRMTPNEPFTFCFWAKCSAPVYVFRFGTETTTSAPRFYLYTTTASNGMVQWDFTASQSQAGYRFTIEKMSEWHHYLFRKTTKNKLELYLDGQLQTFRPALKAKGDVKEAMPKSIQKSKSDGRETTQIDGDATAPFTRFGFGHPFAPKEPSTLLVDEVCWYNRELTETEIAKLAKKP